MVDEAKLHEFVGQMLNDLGGAVSIGLVSPDGRCAGAI